MRPKADGGLAARRIRFLIWRNVKNDVVAMVGAQGWEKIWWHVRRRVELRGVLRIRDIASLRVRRLRPGLGPVVNLGAGPESGIPSD